MSKSIYKSVLKEVFSRRSNVMIFLGFAVVLLILFIVLIRGSSNEATDTIRPDQIKIQKGDKIVIVSEDGSVEYITPDGTYYDTWDSQKTSFFFAEIRALARANLNKAPPSEGTEGYWITLFIDGKLVKVFIEGTNEYIEEVFEDLSELESGRGSEEEEPSEDVFSGNSPTPTQIPTSSFLPSPTPSPGAFVGGGSVEEDCRLWLEQGLGSTVISNTVCIMSSPSPTP